MKKPYTPREEFWNSITHGLGIVAASVGAGVLATLAVLAGDPWMIVSVIVFGVTLILLYSASTMYHLAVDPRRKAALKVLDHACIYLLIAGTYTPFMLGPLRHDGGWILFSVVWFMAICGVIFKLFYAGRFNRISTLVYIAMGWLAIFAIGPMLEHLSRGALWWMFAGGAFYTLGTVFYHNQRIPNSHAIWHLFVIGGSTCHVVAVAML